MTNPQPVRNNRSYATLAAAIVIAAVVLSAGVFASSALYSPKTITATATTTDTFAQTITDLSTLSSVSCDYVIPAPCPDGETFTLSVNYTGPWTVTYQGYNEVCYNQRTSISTCNSDLQTLSGSYEGSGSYSRNVTVGGQGNGWTLCAKAQKSDASGSLLILNVSGARNETALAMGATSTCSIELLV